MYTATQHTTHNTQHTTRNTQHTTQNVPGVAKLGNLHINTKRSEETNTQLQLGSFN